MERSRALRAGVVSVLLGGCLCLAACSSGDSTPATASADVVAATATPTTAAPTPAYESRRFRPALTVQPPSWLPAAPATDDEHFLTWVGTGADVDRAVRFLSPVGLYDPGHRPGHLGPIPRDYLAYLRGLTRYGADISAPSHLVVDGHPATIVTASTHQGLDGALGCPAGDQLAVDCFGLQEFAVVRLAVIAVDGTTLLAWARVVPGAPYAGQDFAAFEAMLEGLRFR